MQFAHLSVEVALQAAEALSQVSSTCHSAAAAALFFNNCWTRTFYPPVSIFEKVDCLLSSSVLVMRANRPLNDNLPAKQPKKETGPREENGGRNGGEKKQDEGEGKGDGDGWRQQPAVATCGRAGDSCNLRTRRRGRAQTCTNRLHTGVRQQMLGGRGRGALVFLCPQPGGDGRNYTRDSVLEPSEEFIFHAEHERSKCEGQSAEISQHSAALPNLQKSLFKRETFW